VNEEEHVVFEGVNAVHSTAPWPNCWEEHRVKPENSSMHATWESTKLFFTRRESTKLA
jgi:hypothetical protein